MSSLEEIKAEKNQTIVDMLENILEKANNGEVQSLAIAGLSPSCESFNLFCGDYYPVALVGELRLLERDIIDVCTQTRRQPAWEFCE